MIHARTKIVALIAFALFTAACIAYGAFFWVVSGHKERLGEERLRAAEAEAKKQSLSTLEATVLASAEERARIQEFVLADEDIIELLSLIERTGREQNVTVTTDSLIVNPRDEMFEELNMSLTLTGSFDSVMRMLRILEALPQQSRIPSLTLTKIVEEGQTEWEGRIELRVTKFTKL